MTLAVVLGGCVDDPGMSPEELPELPPLQPSWVDVLGAFDGAATVTVSGISHPGHEASETFEIQLDRRDRCAWRLVRDTSLLPDVVIGGSGPVQAAKWEESWLVQSTAAPVPGLLGSLSGDPCRLLTGLARFSALDGEGPNYTVDVDPPLHARWLEAIRSRHVYDVLEMRGGTPTREQVARFTRCPAPFELLGIHFEPIQLKVAEDGRPEELIIGENGTGPLLVLGFNYGELEEWPRVEELVEVERYEPEELLG